MRIGPAGADIRLELFGLADSQCLVRLVPETARVFMPRQTAEGVVIAMPIHPIQSQLLGARRADLPPGTPDWVTAELLQKTQELWGKKSGIPVSADEALGIILRVGTLLDVLSRR